MPASAQRFYFPLILLAALLGSVLLGAAPAQARQTRVLLITGDWKSQKWYQDVVMGGKQKYRGRFIEERTNQVAPGEFAFTQMTNYVAQEYLDSNCLSQFDVVLMGDVVDCSLPPKAITALKQFITNGGGFIYCASYKWNTGFLNGSPLSEVLPASLKPASEKTDDWSLWKYELPDHNFRPVEKMPDHPTVHGLNWKSIPTLDRAFTVAPKPASQVVLTTPKNAPILVAGTIGKGRTVVSSSMFANDELSPKLQDWQDLGKFYAQTFKWLAANSPGAARACQPTEGLVRVSIDATKKQNAVTASEFGFNAVIFPPNLGKLSGVSLNNYERLNTGNALTRMGTGPWGFAPARGQFRWAEVDKYMAECSRLHLRPELVADGMIYTPWIGTNGALDNITDAQIKDCCDWLSALLQHTNHGTGTTAGYRPVIEYVEVCNEPNLNATTIKGYIKLYNAVAERVHKNFPGVKVGALGGNELPYVDWFLDATKGKVDFISRHPYGWTPDMLFGLQDGWNAYCKAKGYPAPHYMITEWDFWIAGAPKFDYMMKRGFATVKRSDLIAAMHYRLDQYPEPTYIFGALWAGFGPGKDKTGMPITDVYDANLLFSNFRGQRVQTATSCSDPKLSEHVYADSSVENNGDVSSVVYYDHGFDGNGCSDFNTGKQYNTVQAVVEIKMPPQPRNRTLTMCTSSGEGAKSEQQPINIAANQSQAKVTVALHPHQGIAISIR